MSTNPTIALPARLLAILRARRWALSYSPPPYADELPFPDAPRRPPSYSMLLLDGPTGGDERDDLQHVIRALRSGLAMPCFVRAHPENHALAPSLRAAVTPAGGELLPATEPIGERAREILTQRRDLASDWISWLDLRYELTWRQDVPIRALLSHPDGFRSSTDALEAADVDDRSARRWLKAANLPPPSAWFYAGRILRALLRLQRDPSLPVDAMAMQQGYSGADTFSNQMFRYFGHGAAKGRLLLGLEARFHAFETFGAARRS